MLFSAALDLLDGVDILADIIYFNGSKGEGAVSSILHGFQLLVAAVVQLEGEFLFCQRTTLQGLLADNADIGSICSVGVFEGDGVFQLAADSRIFLGTILTEIFRFWGIG